MTTEAPIQQSGAMPLLRPTLRDRTAVVTGGSGSIGYAIALALHELGASVLALDLELDKRAHPEGLRFKKIDLSNAQELDSLCDAIVSGEIKVDILVNNAGILTNNKLQATSPEELQAISRVNVDAPLRLTQAVTPHMKDQGWGRIINMTSFAWKAGGLTAGTSYCVSKAALTGLTFSNARELAGCGITVNGIAPAYVLSPMVEVALSDSERSSLLKQIPVGRFCQPEEVAHTVAFLASPFAGFITGEIVDMNGGLQFD